MEKVYRDLQGQRDRAQPHESIEPSDITNLGANIEAQMLARFKKGKAKAE